MNDSDTLYERYRKQEAEAAELKRRIAELQREIVKRDRVIAELQINLNRK